MSDFYNVVLKAISDYKLILRRNLSAIKCAAKIQELRIKRNHIRNIDEIGLYKIGLKIIAELKKHAVVSPRDRSNNFYHGSEEFLKYLEELFDKYLLEEDRVVHVRQKVTCSLVAAIQLVALYRKNFTKEIIKKIEEHRVCVHKYGSAEEKKLFADKVQLDQFDVAM